MKGISKRADIAPHRSPIDGITVPQNRVHEVNEATEGRPNHVHACPHVHTPGREMPPEGNDRKDEADSREYCEYGVEGGHPDALGFLSLKAACLKQCNASIEASVDRLNRGYVSS